MRSRYYNVDIKRFINQDVVVGTITDSPSLNQYAYCQGNPVNQFDPFGLSPKKDKAKAWYHQALDFLGLFWDGADVINTAIYLAEGKKEEAALCVLSSFPTFVGLGLKAVKFGMKLTSKSADLIKGTVQIQKAMKNAPVSFSKIGGEIGDGIADYQKLSYKASNLADNISDAKVIGATLDGALDNAGDIGRIADDVADLKVGKSLGKVKSRGDGLPLECNLQFFASGSKSVTVGENNQSIVYRVIRSDENPMNGLTAKNPTRGMSIEGHIVSGSRNKGSQFFSTTTDINVANKYALQDGCRIVEIDLNKLPSNVNIYDLSTAVGRNTYLKGVTAKNFAAKSSEVLLEGYIPSDAINLR